MSAQQDVLDFWFGSNPDDGWVARQYWQLWWTKSDQTDRDIEQRFGRLVTAAALDELDDWTTTPRGCLALIIVLDQFPRNIFRDTSKAFACDKKALGLTLRLLEQATDRQLRPIERVFAYLPLEHSESLADQQRCVELMQGLEQEVPEAWRKTFAGFTGYAVAHYNIINQFGRFPHRNVILERESTPEEREFLQKPGSSF